ncbi:unnamed protein product [Alopecurus aequalis]
MACLSPSPSGRRLSELREEKQEPFFLDLHLLQKGCSGRLLDGYDTALCWPAAAAGNEAASVLKRLTSKKKKAATAASSRGKNQQKPPPGSGLLRMLLSKILHGKPANRKNADEVAGQEGTDYSCSDYDEDDDDKKLSPVSVMEHPFQRKCSNVVQGSPKNAMAIVRELLLEAAYTPELLNQLLAKSEDLIKDTTDLDYEVDDCYYHRTSPKNIDGDDQTAAATGAAYWETHRAELAMVSELVAMEVPKSRLDSADVEPERRDVSADVEAAVLEALLLELVMDLDSCQVNPPM